mmetsp:Transcript_6287/g.15856  ORF Transcript_6287/g.15856 Transcript_6287/m.15856 type:complete len:220 (+) Transcript_6287:356-1015(+)
MLGARKDVLPVCNERLEEVVIAHHSWHVSSPVCRCILHTLILACARVAVKLSRKNLERTVLLPSLVRMPREQQVSKGGAAKADGPASLRTGVEDSPSFVQPHNLRLDPSLVLLCHVVHQRTVGRIQQQHRFVHGFQGPCGGYANRCNTLSIRHHPISSTLQQHSDHVDVVLPHRKMERGSQPELAATVNIPTVEHQFQSHVDVPPAHRMVQASPPPHVN